MSDVIYVLAYYSDGGAPELKFFAPYRGIEAARQAAEWGRSGQTVVVGAVPSFDAEKVDPQPADS